MKKLIFTFVAILFLSQQQTLASEKQAPEINKPPGQFLLITMDDVPVFRTYIDCRGELTPTVIIDVGLGDASANWLGIVDQLAERNIRTCVYDRAGYGYSDVGPGKRTSRQISWELRHILDQAKVPGPYIMVGHSFGGFTAMQFANMFPELTVGLVLVDSSHPEQVERLSRLDEVKASRLLIKQESIIPEDANHMERKWFMLNSSRKAVFTQMDELRYFKDSAFEVSQIKIIRNIPAAVITRGIEQLPEIDGISMEAEWQYMQKDLLNKIENSWQVIAEKSGHLIYREAPEVIIDNVLKVHAISSTQSSLSR